MGNIVTPDQGYLPTPAYGAGVVSPYPWWLNAALAIWALLALLCCLLLLLLALLRYCLRWCRYRQYAADARGKSWKDRMFGAGGVRGRSGGYVERNPRFASAPLPPLPQDDIYGDGRPYVGAGFDNRGLRGESESYSEEEISTGTMAKEAVAIPVIAAKSTGAIVENVEHNITKNYIINEERNYYIQKDPVIETHQQEIQRLPAPTVTTVNMAAERVTDNTNWEKTDAISAANDPSGSVNNQRASSQIVSSDPSVFQQDIHYESQPKIFTHRPPTPPIQTRAEEKKTVTIDDRKTSAPPQMVSDDDERGSTTSEMSGHDSESIYETIRVFTPKKRTLPPLEDEDIYGTAGIDEVEIEIKDLVRLQKANDRSGDPYRDIISSNVATSRRRLTPRQSSASSSSTLNNLVPLSYAQQTLVTGEEKQEETVTETIQTQQIQTTFRQLGQQLDDSAFFIPLTASSTIGGASIAGAGGTTRQMRHDGAIFIPVSSSTTIHHEEKPALYDDRERSMS